MQIQLLDQCPVKGDSITLVFNIDTDITDWKIRGKLEDNCGNCISLATANVSGGSNDQIEITNLSTEESEFTLYIAEGETSCFADKAFLYIQVETTSTVGGKPEKQTVYKVEVRFIKQIID